MGIEEEYPKGVCKECYIKSKTIRPLMQIGGKYQCPDCSSRHSESSGIVNTIKDPGHEAFISGKLESTAPEFEPSLSISPKLDAPLAMTLSYIDLLQRVYNFLHAQPVTSLPHARQLLKLKKKVLTLQNDIKLFLDQK